MVESRVRIYGFILFAVIHLHTIASQNIAQYDGLYRVPTSETMAFTNERFKPAMSDSVYFMSVFDDGSVLMFSLFHYETSLFERWGVYALFSEISKSTGLSSESEIGRYETIWVSESIDGGSVIIDPERLSVSSGDNTIVGEEMSYQIDWRAGEIDLDLHFDNKLQPWILGDGYDILGDPDHSFQRRSVFSPWANVSGTITITDSEGGSTVREVSGEGMAEKAIIVNGLNKFNPELISMRVFGIGGDTLGRELTSGLHIGLLDSTAHPSYGSVRLPRLFVTRDDTWLFATGSYTIEFLEMGRVSNLPYEYPLRFSLDAEDEGYKLRGTFTTESLINTTDILAELPTILRRLVLIFVDRPVYYRTVGLFEGTLTHPDGGEEIVKLYGPYEYVIAR